MGFIENLKEGGREGDEEGGGGPEESAVGDDVGPIVPGRQVSGDGVTNRLHHRSEEGQEAQPGWARMQRFPHLLVHSRQQRFVRSFHYSGQIHQHQRQRARPHPPPRILEFFSGFPLYLQHSLLFPRGWFRWSSSVCSRKDRRRTAVAVTVTVVGGLF